MPRELIATAPRTPVLREYEEPPLAPGQVRIRTEFASPKHGTELVGYRDDPAAHRPYDREWGAVMSRSTGSERGFPRPLGNMATGVVTEVGYDGSYGNKTVVTLDDGTEIWYCHQSSQTVSVGDVVAPGETIGAVGSTGNTTGPHLHLEVRPDGGDPVDPYTVLAEHGVSP